MSSVPKKRSRVKKIQAEAKANLVKGRPPRKGKPKLVSSKKERDQHFQQIACDQAKKVNEDLYLHYRGAFYIAFPTVALVVYNNYPFDVDSSIRVRELKRVEMSVIEIGMDLLARGEYGDYVEEIDGGQLKDVTKGRYTQTLLFKCREDRLDLILDIIEEEAQVAYHEASHLNQQH